MGFTSMDSSIIIDVTPFYHQPSSIAVRRSVLLGCSFAEMQLFNYNCALPGYYAASGGNLLPTFRDNLSFQIFKGSRIKNKKNPVDGDR
jgi:hypothetical protein